MRLYRFIFIGVLATFLALGYVYQQIEIVKAGYHYQDSRRHYQSLLEENSKLRYDLSRIESPQNLLASLQDSRTYFARRRGITREHIVSIESYDESPEQTFFGNFMNSFTVSAEASPE